MATHDNMLDEIISFKKGEVADAKEFVPSATLEKSIYFESDTISFKSHICRSDLSGVIAEFKRRSPSKGDINENADVEQISVGYMEAGASALSILTDKNFFGGSIGDLCIARKFNSCPILRKDFIIDEYQIIESKAIGADAILLIAAVLTPDETKSLAAFAQSLNLEVLLEVRSKKEIGDYVTEYIDVVGVNNRNLKTFKVDIKVSLELAEEIPKGLVKISESGISDPETAHTLRSVGYNGLLVGEQFMKSDTPHISCGVFIKEFRELR